MAPLRPHLLETTTDALLGRQGHGLPALVVGVLVAEADLAILDRENMALGQCAPVDIPAQVIQDRLRAVHGRFAGDDPPPGPDRFGTQQVGPFLLHQRPKQTTQELREGLDRYHGGRAGRPPRGSISGDPTGRDQAVHVRMGGQGTGPGVPHTPHPDQPADVVWVRGQRDERWRRDTAPDVVAIRLMTADNLPELVGHGEDDVNERDRQAWEASCSCPQWSHGHRCPPQASVRQELKSSMALCWLGRRSLPNRAQSSGPSRRKTSATAGMPLLPHV